MRASTLVETEPSERERVMRYLWRRIKVAFNAGNEEETQSLHQFYSKLELMTDAEYLYAYEEEI